jgi:hypothetical protein
MKNLAIIIATLFALILSSCTEVIEPIINTPLQPANSLNAYDYMGEQHNDGVKYLLDNFGDEIAARMATDPIGAETFIFEKALENAKVDSVYYMEFRHVLGMGNQASFRKINFFNLDSLRQIPPYNPFERLQLQSVIDQVTPMPHSTTKELNAIITKIIALENKYFDNAEIEHKEAFLGTLSVMRHSVYLWGNDPNNGGAQLASRPWWQIVLGDCIGAGVGTLLGGPGVGVGLGSAVSTALATSEE